MKKRIMAALLAATIAAPIVTTATEPLSYYRQITSEMDVIQIVDASELTGDMLRSRSEDGIIYIEIVYGVCLDEEGNGRILNPADPDYDYISYANVEGVSKGDVVMTYCLYNPDTDYEDDIISWFDYIIERGE